MLLSLLIVGGVGSPRGAVVGAAVVGTSLELLRRLLTAYGLPQDIRFLVFALALVLFVHLRPRGLFPDYPAWLTREGDPDLPATTTGARSAPLSPGATLLDLEQVTRTFGGVVALDQLSLRVRPRECLALIGPNGSG